MNNFTTRTLTGFLFVVILIGSILLSPYAFLVVFLAITVGTLVEFYRLAGNERIKVQAGYGIACGSLMFVLSFLTSYALIPQKYLLLILPAVFLVPVIELFREKEDPFGNIAWTILGLFYVAGPLSLLSYIRFHTGIGGILMGYFIIIWSYDSFAYLTGITFGRHRLFERISPKKSWEGAIGGVIITLGLLWPVSLLFTELSFVQWLALAIIIFITCTLGDLAESLFKRSIGIKDSGSLFPGHGGFLDRFDAVLLSSPFVFTYLQLFC
ncbi:MAG: phosphatidate cytidylyltransferase [Bacteroidia bacterium]|nr:phosphatidate cytidylyltransferase [Bacteroidia bacterium]